MDEHCTSECQNPQQLFCVLCKSNTHASWNRGCPEFSRRIAKLDENYPENALKYFPTDEDWTLANRQTNLDVDFDQPAKIAIASLPPPVNKGSRLVATRSIVQGKAKKVQPAMLESQATLDNFISRSQENPSNTQDEEDVDKKHNLRLRAKPLYNKQGKSAQIDIESEDEAPQQIETASMSE